MDACRAVCQVGMMKCGVCGEEISEDSLEFVQCFACTAAVPVHRRCKPLDQSGKVGCSQHVPKLSLTSESPFKVPLPVRKINLGPSNPTSSLDQEPWDQNKRRRIDQSKSQGSPVPSSPSSPPLSSPFSPPLSSPFSPPASSPSGGSGEIFKVPQLPPSRNVSGMGRGRGLSITSIKVDSPEPSSSLSLPPSKQNNPSFSKPLTLPPSFSSGGFNEGMPRNVGPGLGFGSRSPARAKKTRKTCCSKMLLAMCTAAERCAPAVRVTYTRLDRLHDAWNSFQMMGCKELTDKHCPCQRCVTMDILTITHIVEQQYFAKQLDRLVQYIAEVCDGQPWALASLMPGKSNFFLCGWLVKLLPMSARPPSCLYLTSVNDTRFWEDYPWIEFRDEDSSDPHHIFVLDDVSYSGTQFSNLLGQVCANAGKAQVHACPLFVTPHAGEYLQWRLGGAVLWKHCITLLGGEQLFKTLGVHRMSTATSFQDLCMKYSFAWSDGRFVEASKTLTTYVPFYKIPDYFSCPEKAYMTPISGPWSTDQEIQEYTFTTKKKDQEPAYKEIAGDMMVKHWLG